MVLSLASAAFAGDYHSGASLVCSDCHVMHFSQSHAHDDGSNAPLGTGPNAYLLRDDAAALCLSCHDGVPTIPDVLGNSINPGYNRQAGALNETGGVDGYTETDGHTLGYTGAVPGNATNLTDAFACHHCHAAHGSGAPLFGAGYRNLGGYGTGLDGSGIGQVSYSSADVEANPLDVWVFQDVSSSVSGSGNTLADHYDQANITFNEPAVDDGLAYGDFCAGCHGDFHGDPGGANIGGAVATGHFERHPVAGVDIGGIGGGHSSMDEFAPVAPGKTNWVQVMSPAGKRANDATNGYVNGDADLTPSCMSCHKGHGNMNAFGLIYMTGTGTITEEGDGGAYRDLCKQCHVQG